MKIYFVRHGETNWNKDGRLQGRSDIPLNEAGISMAHATANALSNIPFDKVFSSPLIRAYKTAEILSADRNLKINTDERLLELSFGSGEGESLTYIKTHPESKLYNFIYNPQDYVPYDEGETLESLYDRCGSFLKDVIFPLENTVNNILIVGHGALIRGMIYHMTNRETKDFWSVSHKNCSVTIAEYEGGKLSLLEEGKVLFS